MHKGPYALLNWAILLCICSCVGKSCMGYFLSRVRCRMDQQQHMYPAQVDSHTSHCGVQHSHASGRIVTPVLADQAGPQKLLHGHVQLHGYESTDVTTINKAARHLLQDRVDTDKSLNRSSNATAGLLPDQNTEAGIDISKESSGALGSSNGSAAARAVSNAGNISNAGTLAAGNTQNGSNASASSVLLPGNSTIKDTATTSLPAALVSASNNTIPAAAGVISKPNVGNINPDTDAQLTEVLRPSALHCPAALPQLPTSIISQQALKSCPLVVAHFVQGTSKVEKIAQGPVCSTVMVQNNKPETVFGWQLVWHQAAAAGLLQVVAVGDGELVSGSGAGIPNRVINSHQITNISGAGGLINFTMATLPAMSDNRVSKDVQMILAAPLDWVDVYLNGKPCSKIPSRSLLMDDCSADSYGSLLPAGSPAVKDGLQCTSVFCCGDFDPPEAITDPRLGPPGTVSVIPDGVDLPPITSNALVVNLPVTSKEVQKEVRKAVGDLARNVIALITDGQGGPGSGNNGSTAVGVPNNHQQQSNDISSNPAATHSGNHTSQSASDSGSSGSQRATPLAAIVAPAVAGTMLLCMISAALLIRSRRAGQLAASGSTKAMPTDSEAGTGFRRPSSNTDDSLGSIRSAGELQLRARQLSNIPAYPEQALLAAPPTRFDSSGATVVMHVMANPTCQLEQLCHAPSGRQYGLVSVAGLQETSGGGGKPYINSAVTDMLSYGAGRPAGNVPLHEQDTASSIPVPSEYNVTKQRRSIGAANSSRSTLQAQRPTAYSWPTQDGGSTNLASNSTNFSASGAVLSPSFVAQNGPGKNDMVAAGMLPPAGHVFRQSVSARERHTASSFASSAAVQSVPAIPGPQVSITSQQAGSKAAHEAFQHVGSEIGRPPIHPQSETSRWHRPNAVATENVSSTAAVLKSRRAARRSTYTHAASGRVHHEWNAQPIGGMPLSSLILATQAGPLHHRLVGNAGMMETSYMHEHQHFEAGLGQLPLVGTTPQTPLPQNPEFYDSMPLLKHDGMAERTQPLNLLSRFHTPPMLRGSNEMLPNLVRPLRVSVSDPTGIVAHLDHVSMLPQPNMPQPSMVAEEENVAGPSQPRAKVAQASSLPRPVNDTPTNDSKELSHSQLQQASAGGRRLSLGGSSGLHSHNHTAEVVSNATMATQHASITNSSHANTTRHSNAQGNHVTAQPKQPSVYNEPVLSHQHPVSSNIREERWAPIDFAQDVVIQRQLGAGAFGTVYAAVWMGAPAWVVAQVNGYVLDDSDQQHGWDLDVAVKVVPLMIDSTSYNARTLDSLKQEIQVLSQVCHPHVIRFLGACLAPPNVCIIEQLARGGSLHTVLHSNLSHMRESGQELSAATAEASRRLISLAEGGMLPIHQVLRLASQVASAMAYLHDMRVVHRDLKAANVLLDEQGHVLVADFGIAKFRGRTFLSTRNVHAGTPAYMAPEQFEGRLVSEHVDQWAFGVLVWEMLTRQLPWSDLDNPMQIIFNVGVKGQRLALPPHCPQPLAALIHSCWRDDPATRPPFSHLYQQLQHMLQQQLK